MYYRVKVSSNVNIVFIVVAINIMLRWYLAESIGHYWQPAQFVNVVNPDFDHLKHLQNSGHLLLPAPSVSYKKLGGNNISPNSLNVTVSYHYHSENRTITQYLPSMITSATTFTT